jgi:hypothetical protein
MPLKTRRKPVTEAKILASKEQTVEEVTESRTRITFGLDLVKLKKQAVPKYHKPAWREVGRI